MGVWEKPSFKTYPNRFAAVVSLHVAQYGILPYNHLIFRISIVI